MPFEQVGEQREGIHFCLFKAFFHEKQEGDLKGQEAEEGSYFLHT